MAKCLLFLETNGGKLKSSSLELFTPFHGSTHEVSAVVLGAGSKGASAEAFAYGAKTVFFSENSSLTNYNSELYSQVISDLIKENGFLFVLASGSALAKDLFPRVASALDGGVVSDATQVSADGDRLVAKKPLLSGKCFAKVKFSQSGPQVVLLRPNQLEVLKPNTSASGTAKEISVKSMDLKTLVKDVVKGASAKLDLTEANIIVAGGRGMKGPEHFKLLQDLADVLGATVGASRAVVDAGWVSHSMQVGQTGKTVAPTLYIACGISGAIQHLAGMSSSKVIVAINKDPEAPIFKKATYGINGDVFEVLPKLTEEFKKLLSK